MAWTVLNHGNSGYVRGCRCDICKHGRAEARRIWTLTGARSHRPPVDVVDDRVGRQWIAKAACKGHDTSWWFDGKPTDKTWRQAIEICAACPVRTQCLEWALQWPVHDLHGIWGGTSQRERIRILDQRKAPTCQPITLRTTGRVSGESWNNS